VPVPGAGVIAAVAYVDPGNFATNISGGAQFGYLLLCVILTSNLMAMLIQSMSAKLGIATGKNLPEVFNANGLTEPQPLTGHKPGGALFRHPLRPDPTADSLPQPRPDGGAGQPASDHGGVIRWSSR